MDGDEGRFILGHEGFPLFSWQGEGGKAWNGSDWSHDEDECGFFDECSDERGRALYYWGEIRGHVVGRDRIADLESCTEAAKPSRCEKKLMYVVFRVVQLQRRLALPHAGMS